MKERSSFARRPRAGGGRGTFEIHSNSMMASRDSAWKEGGGVGRTDGRADERALASPITGISIFLGGRSFARGNGDGEKWEGRERREEGMKGNYFCMSLIQMSRSAVRRAGRVGALRQEVESIKRWHRSGFLGRWTNHSLHGPRSLRGGLYSCLCVSLVLAISHVGDGRRASRREQRRPRLAVAPERE